MVALALAVGVVASASEAQVYKCTDGAGKVVYSGQPCEYGGKPLPLPDNTVQGQRVPSEAGAGSASDGDAGPTATAQCVQAQRDLAQVTSRPPPNGIAENNRYRQAVAQSSAQARIACG